MLETKHLFLILQNTIKQRDSEFKVRVLSTHMIQIPKADVRILEPDPQEMACIYFSLENQINLVQASQTPDDTIKYIQRRV